MISCQASPVADFYRTSVTVDEFQFSNVQANANVLSQCNDLKNMKYTKMLSQYENIYVNPDTVGDWWERLKTLYGSQSEGDMSVWSILTV